MRRAFTLIELLIVISIVLVLTTIGITSFSAARKNLTIDLESDTLIAMLHTLRNETRTLSGCRGISFMKNRPTQKIEAEYENPVKGCGAPHSAASALSSEIVISNIMIDNRTHDSFSIMFTPPYGIATFSPSGEIGEVTLALRNAVARSKTIRINKVTGSIEKNN